MSHSTKQKLLVVNTACKELKLRLQLNDQLLDMWKMAPKGDSADGAIERLMKDREALQRSYDTHASRRDILLQECIEGMN